MLENIMKTLGDFFATSGVKILSSIILFVVCWKLIGFLLKLIKKGKAFSRLDESVRGFILSFVSIALKILLFLTIAANLGVPMTNIVALIGSCGLAIGLSLQGGLANFAGGLLILIFRPFRVGDYIETSGNAGTVKNIAFLYTTITTPDNKTVVIPNGTLSNSTVTNYTIENKRRVDLVFSVAYDTDINRVKKILTVISSQHELVLKDPEPFARLSKQGDSALEFSLRVWCKQSDYWAVYFDLNEQVKEAFDKVGIDIPFPQIDVHMAK